MLKSPDDVTVDWYIDTAREKARIPSDGKLAIGMEMARVNVNHWRQKKSLPSDENMVKLAKLTGVDPRVALIDCKIWSAKDPATADVWRSIKKALKLLPLFLLLILAKPSFAADFAASVVKSERVSLYIMYSTDVVCRRLGILVSTSRADLIPSLWP